MGKYDYDNNDILTETLKNREGQSIANEHKTLYNRLSTKVLKLLFQKIDNEASNTLIQSLQDKTLTLSY